MNCKSKVFDWLRTSYRGGDKTHVNFYESDVQNERIRVAFETATALNRIVFRMAWDDLASSVVHIVWVRDSARQ